MLSDDQKRGFALQLKANPLWVEVIEDMKARQIANWRAGKTPESREEAWHSDVAVRAIEKRVNNWAEQPVVTKEDT